MCEGGCPNIQLYPKEVTNNSKIEESATAKGAKKGVRVDLDRGQTKRQDSN